MTINHSSSIGTAGGIDKLPRIEVLLRKNCSRMKSPIFEKKSPIDRGSLDETRTNIDKNSLYRDIFEKFEIALIKADQVVFNSQKVALLSFNIVSEQKAKN
jgi:hypothetical protein